MRAGYPESIALGNFFEVFGGFAPFVQIAKGSLISYNRAAETRNNSDSKEFYTMTNQELANLIYPSLPHTPEDYEAMYPERDLPEGAMVTRLGPSPTGFIHLGNLYGAFVDERLAHQSGGTFFLRIEDTDDKRFVENAVETIITSLAFFDIRFDEGVTQSGAGRCLSVLPLRG